MLLYAAINDLADTYKSIDVRVAAILTNNAWKVLYLVVRFRRDNPSRS